MAKSTGKFQLVNADEDNFDNIMAAVGISAEHRALSRQAKPIVEYIENGDNYQCILSNPGLPDKITHFTLNVEQEETALGGRKVMTTYKRDGKRLVQHEKMANGQVIVYDREVKGDEMHVKVTCGDLVANRLFKKI